MVSAVHRAAIGAVGMLATVLITACPPPSSVSIYNNTGQSMQVLVNGHPTPWKAGATFRIGDDVDFDDLEWQSNGAGHATFVLVVLSSQGLTRYRLVSNGQLGGYALDGEGRVDGFLQLEKDGRLFVVKGPPRYPVKKLPKQPSGWPLTPACDCPCGVEATP